MERRRQHAIHRPLLDNAPEIHHSDPVGHVPHQRQVMRDQDQRDPARRLQIRQQIDDRRLHRDIERRHRLIGNHQIRIAGNGTRQRDPLFLSAGKLLRLAIDHIGRHPHPLQQSANLLPRRRLRQPAQ